MADNEKRKEQQKAATAKYRAGQKAALTTAQDDLRAAQDDNARLRAQLADLQSAAAPTRELADLQSAAAPTRELADFPAITERVDLTKWRDQIDRFYNVSGQRWGKNNSSQGNIDVSTPNFEALGDLVTELGELLIPEEAERRLVGQLAAKIGVNTTGAVGLYQTGYRSSCHCHVLPVKNLMLSGMKAWKFWAPGTFAKLNHQRLPTAPPATPPAVCIDQEEGDVLWIPPGWLHSVDTIQEGPLRDPNSVSVASAYATWAFPMTFRALALARWTTGLSVEHQTGGIPCPDMKAATSRDYLRLFGAIPPTETLPDPTTTPDVYPPANGLATRPAL